MTESASSSMASYELPLPTAGPALPARRTKELDDSFSKPLLLQNVLWFCRLRWIVIAFFVAFGVVGYIPPLMETIGLRSRLLWPFVVAAVLALTNIGFLGHARVLVRLGGAVQARVNLWAQIVLDLMVLTVVVHYLGSLETYALFTYLFHIALACIFFSRAESFGVTALACALYAGCVALEESGVISSSAIYINSSFRQDMEKAPGFAALNGVSALVIWIVVWYLTSHLSGLVRQRDFELAETNRRLVEAQEERSRHLLHTTHELKAPFSAIHSNVQLLLRGYCGVLPDEARKVLERIAARCRRLAAEIQEMLQLANLASAGNDALQWIALDVSRVLEWAVEQVAQIAAERSVRIETDMEPTPTIGVEDHLKMLFANVLSNAVVYSRGGGVVRVSCARAPVAGPTVVIEDHGIGISAEKIPHIFDEYYRTNEAVRHNPESTGLGMAIVKGVVQSHGIRLRVDSAPGVGTRVTLKFP